MVELCLNNDTAMMQVRDFFITDPECLANTLWVDSFGTTIHVQTNLILLGKFSMKLAHETFKQIIDSFKKLIADVRAIDRRRCRRAQILKESVIPITAL